MYIYTSPATEAEEEEAGKEEEEADYIISAAAKKGSAISGLRGYTVWLYNPDTSGRQGKYRIWHFLSK